MTFAHSIEAVMRSTVIPDPVATALRYWDYSERRSFPFCEGYEDTGPDVRLERYNELVQRFSL